MSQGVLGTLFFSFVSFVGLGLAGCGSDDDVPADDGGARDDTGVAPRPDGSFDAGPPPPADCTDGVDCYCDAVAGDPALLLCEDFEVSTLYEAGGVGGGTPDFGPFFDDGGNPGQRGDNSYWFRTYGGAGFGCLAHETPNPVTPRFGSPCNVGGSGFCIELGEWCSTAQGNLADGMGRDCWQSNDNACIDIVRNGDYADEIADVAEPMRPDGTRGVFHGRQALSQRVAAGQTAGIYGLGAFGRTVREIGVTMALAYPATTMRSGIWTFPWKHNEWSPTNDGIFLFHNTGALEDFDPFSHFMFYASGSGDQPACDAALGAATVRLGDLYCSDAAFGYRADLSVYDRARDFPFDTWRCVRGHLTGIGTDAMSVRIWIDDTLIIDFDGFDSRFIGASEGYDGLTWNNYANANQEGGTPTTETSFRYEDNVHIREGEPVGCEQIGFD